jgi:SAM-dependent methyltransferase
MNPVATSVTTGIPTLTWEQLMNTLYADIDGYGLSSRARERTGDYGENLTYGEVSPESMSQLLTAIQAKPGEVFYDLGAGTGKGVMYAALLSSLGKCVGIELLDELFSSSILALDRYRNHVLPMLPAERQLQQIQYRLGDMKIEDISDADIVFAHCTCWSPDLMAAITEKFNQLKPGARVITVSKGLESPYFAHTGTEMCQMAWGSATMYYWTKMN